jgi:SAM-dependent methyltransferase
MSARDREDFDFLLATARAGRKQGLDHFIHLDQPVGILNYIRIANDIAARVPAGRLLDWGCGLGQMTWLLRRRGFDVVPFDIASTAEKIPELPLTRDMNVVHGTHPTELPFPDGSFDAVLSCGVLEHVDEYTGAGNELKSLREIRRVLKPGGWFPIYQLPQQHTWQEAITRTLSVGYSHPRRFTEQGARALLTGCGFEVSEVRRYNMLPKNLTGVPHRIRDLYSRFGGVVHSIDRVLSAIPGLNRVAGVLELIARRR